MEKTNISNTIEACIKPENYTENSLGNHPVTDSNYCARVEDESNVTEERIRYIITYAILVSVALYAYIHRTFAFFSICLKASIRLHDRLFRGVTRATMYFYNKNPSGRILNRFSRDINSIDISLPPALLECISVSLHQRKCLWRNTILGCSSSSLNLLL